MLENHRNKIKDIICSPDDIDGKVERIESVLSAYLDWLDTHISPEKAVGYEIEYDKGHDEGYMDYYKEKPNA